MKPTEPPLPSLPTMHGYGYNRLTAGQYEYAWSEDIGRRRERAAQIVAQEEQQRALAKSSDASEAGSSLMGYTPRGGAGTASNRAWPSDELEASVPPELARERRRQLDAENESMADDRRSVLSSSHTSARSSVSSYVSGLSDSVSRIKRLELKLEQERRKRRDLEIALERSKKPQFLRLFGAGESGDWGLEKPTTDSAHTSGLY